MPRQRRREIESSLLEGTGGVRSALLAEWRLEGAIAVAFRVLDAPSSSNQKRGLDLFRDGQTNLSRSSAASATARLTHVVGTVPIRFL